MHGVVVAFRRRMIAMLADVLPVLEYESQLH